MLSSVLIANRSEIACRIARTARRMGLRTIAVYSAADADALHVRAADEAWLIGPSAAESYLDIGKLIDIAKKSRAGAIHPGYGFLSENPEFAEACAKAGIVFIGPPVSAIRAMGHKDRAKALMRDAGVPVVPGYEGRDQGEGALFKAAQSIGYPVMIKAVAGGGGKGMRHVEAQPDFVAALAACRREAKAAFGDERVLIEKFIANPRHIEVQVLADAHGHCVHLFERDCSLQRRHQKIIEEAPAPRLPAKIRQSLCKAAVTAAEAVGYAGAGTVEFIAGANRKGEVSDFFFMEMNTRLQVEHPVTEMILGLDLVELQIRIASDEKLPFAQSAVKPKGHAIEARLYAENPAGGFLPQTGKLHILQWPSDREGLRIDTGVEDGAEITPYYDPMIAKLIAWGETRDAAIGSLRDALQGTVVLGLASNLGFLGRILDHPQFHAGGVTTGFIDSQISELKGEALPSETTGAAILAWLDHARGRGSRDMPDGWSLQGLPRKDSHSLVINGEPVAVEVSYEARGGGVIVARRSDESSISLSPGVRPVSFHDRASETLFVAAGPTHFAIRAENILARIGDTREGAAIIRSPMPGKVIRVLVQENENVAPGQPLIILEAMKMEHTLKAGLAGRVAQLPVEAGSQVKEGDVLCILETLIP